VALNHVYRIRTRGRQRGQRVEFGIHVRNIVADHTPAELATDWLTNIMPLVTAATSASVNFEDLVVSDTAATGDEMFVQALTQPNPGSISGDSLPNQNAAVISFGTGQKGRRRHGRLYTFGLAEGGQTDGNLSGAQLTAITALGAGIVARYGSGGTSANWRFVIYSPPSPPFVAKPPPPTHTDTLITEVTTYKIDPVVRTQRRRSVGVGE